MVGRYIDSMDEASAQLLEIEAWDEETRKEFDAYFCPDVESNVRAELDPTERWTDFYDARGIQYSFKITLVELVEQDGRTTIAVLRWDGSFYWYEEQTEQWEYRVEMRKGKDGWCFAALVDPLDEYLN